MTAVVRWTTHAADQLQQAASHLENEREGYGLRFCDAVDDLLARIAQSPRRFSLVPNAPYGTRPIRRALLHRFGYWLIYEQHPDAVLVLSLWHGRQDPEGWHQM